MKRAILILTLLILALFSVSSVFAGDADDQDGDGFHEYSGDEYDLELEDDDGGPYIEVTTDSS